MLLTELQNLVLKGVREMKHDEWFVGKVTIEDEVKEYPFTAEGIAQSQADWNSVIENTVHGFEQVDVYRLETPLKK